MDTPSKSPPEVPQNKRGCGGMVRTDSSLLQLPLGHWLAGCEGDGPEKRKKHPGVSKCSVSRGAAGPAACPFSSLLHGGHPRETNFTAASLGLFLSRQQNVASGEDFQKLQPCAMYRSTNVPGSEAAPKLDAPPRPPAAQWWKQPQRFSGEAKNDPVSRRGNCRLGLCKPSRSLEK